MVKKALSKEAKVKRVDTNLKLKRAPTKSELEMQVKNSQKTNDALEESNRKKIELIESFEGKIINLEKQIDYLSCQETMLCKETQTEAGLNSKCEEYNFEGENERELGWHMVRISAYFLLIPEIVNNVILNVILKRKICMILMLTHGMIL